MFANNQQVSAIYKGCKVLYCKIISNLNNHKLLLLIIIIIICLLPIVIIVIVI